MKTLLLDRTRWDLCKDAHGNIALASEPYSVIQDVASAARLFRGELWYDTKKGVPYFEEVLGQAVSLPLLKTLLANAATTVPTVVSAKVFISSYKDREIKGQIQSTLSTGQTVVTTLTLPDENPLTTEYGDPITDQFGDPIDGGP